MFFQFNVFTDGFLSNPTSIKISIGHGWILIDDEGFEHSFYVAINEWPSSTRAKISAITTLVYVLPFSSSCKILLDSQLTIDGFREIITNFF